MTLSMRALTASDAARCAELERQLFDGDSPWPESVFAVEFAHSNTMYIGVFDEDNDDLLVGYAGLAMLGPRSDPEFEIHTIAVDASYQRRGIGAQLMAQLINTADIHGGPMFLEVRTDNDPAIKMYERFGFYVLATRRNYYQPSGADAYTMTRKPRGEQ